LGAQLEPRGVKMTSQDMEGFLSSNVDNTIRETRFSFKDWFVLSEDVNRHYHRILTSIKLDINNLQEVYITVLAIRAVETFQGVIILCERGMAAQSRMVLRCLMELLFLIRAGSKNNELVKELVYEDTKTRLKLLNKLKACSEKTREGLIDFPNGDYENELKFKIDENKMSEIKTWYVAKEAGLSDYYNTAYSLLSQTIHTKIGDLDEHFKVNEKNEIVSFHLGPKIENTGLYLVSAIECMFYIIDSLIILFKKGHDPALEDLIRRFKTLADEFKKQHKEMYQYLKSDGRENDPTQA